MNTGAALIGATAIVTSLVLFAMQVNVERLPHRLFRRLSQDRKLLIAFASAFVLAVGVATLSAFTGQIGLAAVLVSAVWAIFLILGLFLYAYKRALRLINPLEQLQMLLDDTRKELRRWARRAERVMPALEDDDEAKPETPEGEHTPDTARTVFFQLNPYWTAEASRGVRHAMTFARRYAEQGDYEVAGGALTAIVGINAAYVEAKGKTFYANNMFMEHPLASDAFINETLEHLRQNADSANGRKDEQQIEQSLQAIGALVPVYLSIDYADSHAEKHHAQLAAGYLANAVQAVVAHSLADVLMEGQRLLGRAAGHFVAVGKTNFTAVLSQRIATIAGSGCASEANRPVTAEGIRQLANLTLQLLRSPSHNARYALCQAHENVNFVAKLLLLVPDTPGGNIHASTLAPYYSSSDMQSLRVHLTELVNAVAAAGPDDENAKTVIRNLERWTDDIYRPAKELLLASVAVKSHFTIHMFQWVQGVTEILLAASSAPACDTDTQRELRDHARWLIATLDWIPSDEKTVTFAENYQLTGTFFEAAADARRHGCNENAEAISLHLLSWAFKGGRHSTGMAILERGLCGCAALALTANAGAVDALKAEISRRLQRDDAPEREVRLHGANSLRQKVRELGERTAGPGYTMSAIDRAMEKLDYGSIATLLEEIAVTLVPEGG